VYETELTETILQGDTWEGIEFTINKPGTNYAGATIKTQYRETPEGVPVLTKDITPSVAIDGQLIFTVSLTAAETKSITTSKLQTDLQITVGAVVRTPILIKFKVIKTITQ